MYSYQPLTNRTETCVLYPSPGTDGKEWNFLQLPGRQQGFLTESRLSGERTTEPRVAFVATTQGFNVSCRSCRLFVTPRYMLQDKYITMEKSFQGFFPFYFRGLRIGACGERLVDRGTKRPLNIRLRYFGENGLPAPPCSPSTPFLSHSLHHPSNPAIYSPGRCGKL